MDEWSVWNLWRWTGELGRLAIFGLALMSARIVVVVVQVCYHYYSARHGETVDTDWGACQRNRKRLVAKLGLWGNSLKSIASTAPSLGLAGTCVGIMDIFGPVYGSRASALFFVVGVISAAFLSTAAGLLVAIPAMVAHNIVRTWVDSLEIELVGGSANKTRFPLRPRLSTFPFQLTAVPVLALSLSGFMMFPSFFPPKGLRVHLMVIAPEAKVPSIEPIVVAVVSTKADVVPTVYVDSKKTAWDELRNKLQSELEARPPHSVVYLQADEDILWQHVMYVTDVAIQLHGEVVVLTIKPDIHRPRGLPR